MTLLSVQGKVFWQFGRRSETREGWWKITNFHLRLLLRAACCSGIDVDGKRWSIDDGRIDTDTEQALSLL